jgi:glycosyltransferase involved in cell wall biosynthesis
MFYGGLGGQQNQESALRCWARIMPIVWESMPSTEFWMVGSNPPRHLQELTSDSRVKVTGFVEDVSSILKSATAVLCPWKGTYGFRSRLIEVMSLGVPVIADADAVFGMDLIAGEGFLPASSDREFANAALALLKEPAYAKSQSVAARAQVEVRFDSKDIYGRMARDLRIWLNERRRPLSVTCV